MNKGRREKYLGSAKVTCTWRPKERERDEGRDLGSVRVTDGRREGRKEKGK